MSGFFTIVTSGADGMQLSKYLEIIIKLSVTHTGIVCALGGDKKVCFLLFSDLHNGDSYGAKA